MNAGAIWGWVAVLAALPLSARAVGGDAAYPLHQLERPAASRPKAVSAPPPAPRPNAAAAAPRSSASAAQAAPRPVERPGTFAPEAARLAARSTAEQRLERDLVRQFAKVARFEAEASKLALTRAHASWVRSFAVELHDQQAGATGELQWLLHTRGMALPMLENAQRKTLARLARYTGQRFDREFLEAVGPRLQRDKVLGYERAQGAAVDPALKAWVDRQLPLVRQQMAAAERIGAGGAQRQPVRYVAPAAPGR